MKHLLWTSITLFVVVLDRITKILVLQCLPLEQPVNIFPGLNWYATYNTGAAFSFLNQPTFWQQWLFGGIAVVVSLVLLRWLLKLPQGKLWLTVAIALILGGSLGNLCDRILYHHVIDFIDVYYATWHWPVFNIADMAISIGALMLLKANIR